MKKLLVTLGLLYALVGCSNFTVKEIVVAPLPHETFRANYTDYEGTTMLEQNSVYIKHYKLYDDKVILVTLDDKEITLDNGEDVLQITVLPKSNMIEE